MEVNDEQEYPPEPGVKEAAQPRIGDEPQGAETAKEVVPGVPIVRSNTPRPMSFGLFPSKTELPLPPSHSAAADFPAQAPGAPPLPEEGRAGREESAASRALPVPERPEALQKADSEFIWLFEYGLEMDPTLLNRSDRLDGAAFTYGPAVLKGYTLSFDRIEPRSEQVVASLAPGQNPQAEVWGTLYRIPRRLTRRQGQERSALEQVHSVPMSEPLNVHVQEMYRKREVECLTYVASDFARQYVHLLPPEKQRPTSAYLQRLLDSARGQKLPASYLDALAHLSASHMGTVPISEIPEQQTEPLPVIDRRKCGTQGEEATCSSSRASTPLPRGLMAFALYLVLLVLITLTLAILQALGTWNQDLMAGFAPLGVPWYVLVYGLLGGCVSCMLALTRQHSMHPPAFVLLTWFARPYISALLAALSYLILNTGFLLLSNQPLQRYALFSIIAALAGLCEGWLLFRRR